MWSSFFCFFYGDKSALLFPTVSKRRRVSGNGQFFSSSSSSSWCVLTVDSESCSWIWEVKRPQRVKRSLFNVPLFTNTPKLMKACPCLLNYVCSITQRTSAIASFLWIWFPQLFLCRERKIHIRFFLLYFVLHKALNETWLPKHKHVRLIVAMKTTYSYSVFWSSSVWRSLFILMERKVKKEFPVQQM